MNLKSRDIPILRYLSKNYFIGLEELSNRLLLSEEDIEKQVEQLKQLGYNLSINKQKGYRIIARPDILLPSEIKNKLTTRYMGQSIYYYPELISTNITANQLTGEKGNKTREGTIVIAEKQSGGKGRADKRWISPPGGIWLSIILYPEVVPSQISLITLMTAVAVTKTIIQLFPYTKVQIKWPNDVLINNRKVCGILTEVNTVANTIKWVIIGIGINVNNDFLCLPADIRENSLSLKEVTGQSIKRVNFIRHLCIELERFYELLKKGDFLAILEEWKLYNNILGKKVDVNIGEKIITGEAIDINEKGALIFKTDTGEIKEIISGIVNLIR